MRHQLSVLQRQVKTPSDGDVLLVVENSDTFDSLLTVLRDRDDHRVTLVGWGAGTGFEAVGFHNRV